jgi:hypothetical protein
MVKFNVSTGIVFLFAALLQAAPFYRFAACGPIYYGVDMPLNKQYSGTIQLNAGEKLINSTVESSYSDYVGSCASGCADFLAPVYANAYNSKGFYLLNTYYPKNATAPVYDPHYSVSNLQVNYNQGTGLITWQFVGYNSWYCDYYSKNCDSLGNSYYYIVLNIDKVAGNPQLLSLNKPAFASSAEAPCYVASLAVDGDLVKRWSSKFTDSEWFMVDLGSTLQITEVKLMWETSSAAQYEVQTSNDGINFTKIASKLDGTYGARTDDFKVTASGRYVKMKGIKRTSGYGFSLYEFQVFGYPGGTAVASKLTTPTSPTYASTTEGPFKAANVVDNYPDTRWASNWADNQWIYVDLGSQKTISAVYLEWEAAWASSLNLQTSNNASSWQTFTTLTNTRQCNNLVTNLNLSARYMRMLGTKRGTGYGFSLYNFEVYGK